MSEERDDERTEPRAGDDRPETTPPEPPGDAPPPPPADAPPPPGAAPPPPPADVPPPVGAGPASGSPSGASENRTLMIVLAYLYVFSLVPLLVEKDDAEVQWHAKNGLILLGADVVLALVVWILSAASGGLLGCLLLPFQALMHFALFVVRIVAIVKGTQGGRLEIPVLSGFTEKF